MVGTGEECPAGTGLRARAECEEALAWAKKERKGMIRDQDGEYHWIHTSQVRPLHYAKGCTFFDTADCYCADGGDMHYAERLLARALGDADQVGQGRVEVECSWWANRSVKVGPLDRFKGDDTSKGSVPMIALLVPGRLLLFGVDDPACALKGEISVADVQKVCTVAERSKRVFELRCKGRRVKFAAENAAEAGDWMRRIEQQRWQDDKQKVSPGAKYLAAESS